MGKSNAAVTQLISSKERFADLFNGTVFFGNQIVLPQDLELAGSESDILITDKSKKTKDYNRRRDVVMRWKKDVHLAIFACENQAKVHYSMPIRNMLYDSLSYTEQTKQFWVAHQKEHSKLSDEEFLSRFFKNDNLIPVITVVFYYGENKWDGAVDLYGMFSPDNPVLQNCSLQKYIPNYWINLIDVNNLNEINRFQTDLQQIFGMLQCRKSRQSMQDYMKQHAAYFKNLDIDTYHALAVILHSEELIEIAETLSEGKETIDMCQALEELYQDGISQGITQGISQGISQGIRGLIEAAQEFGRTKEETILKIMEKFNLGHSAAVENVEKYWKTEL